MKDELYRLAGEFMLSEQAREDRRMLMLKVLKGFVMVLALGMAFTAGRVTAEPLSRPTTLQELFKEAIKHGGYKEKCQARRNGCPMPAVVIAEIPNANIEGTFDWRNPQMVNLNTTPHIVPGSLDFNETLVHEFVHYLQWLHGELGPFTGCRDHPKIEEQAYRAGAAYLLQFGIVRDYSDQLFHTMIMAAMCEMEPM